MKSYQKNKPTNKQSTLCRYLGICVSILNVSFFFAGLSFYFYGNKKLSQSKELHELVSHINEKSTSLPFDQTQAIKQNKQDMNDELLSCNDPVWCMVDMPRISHYRFDPPTDKRKWKKAQLLASSGDQIILQKIQQIFSNPLDFIDGDREFRRIHHLIDVFIDKNRSLSDLIDQTKLSKYKEKQLDSSIKSYVPFYNYNFRWADRSPIVQLGYTVFEKNRNAFFTGNILGYHGVEMLEFLRRWDHIKDDIEVPFIAICQGNENWGMLSTMFPDRTAKWGNCCSGPKYKLLHDFLNHNKTLMLLINQHHNVSHPKVLSLPRGIPLTWEATPRLVWDSIRYVLKYVKKTKLLFAASSNWGKRPQIIQCISDKMDPNDFEGHSAIKIDTETKKLFEEMKKDRKRYYEKLSTSRFGLALPGLGYDCFRTWELLTMGTIVVIERGVGLDRTLWRLPALLVEDFNDITPQLLRSAYVEAMYRIIGNEFELERLRQSYWYTMIMNVSLSKSIDPMLAKFPMTAVDLDFMRPRERFDCWESNSCGKGTLRIPKKSC